MNGVTPYIAFQGNCEEAINFYKECLNGEVLYIQRYGDSPMAQEGYNDKIMHTTIKIGGSHLMACDNPPGQPAAASSNISLAVGSNNVEEAERMFNAMSEGGSVTMPLQETFWAERFGMLTDKFGINWMFNCEKPRDEAEQASA